MQLTIKDPELVAVLMESTEKIELTDDKGPCSGHVHNRRDWQAATGLQDPVYG